MAGVALGDIDCHFAWQVWHLATSTVTLRGRRGYLVTSTMWQAYAGVVLAGVALGDIDCHFAWQVWDLATSTLTLHNKRGTW